MRRPAEVVALLREAIMHDYELSKKTEPVLIEAAALIEIQAAEIERLRSSLRSRPRI
jgi:hypothetical protein